MYTAQSSATHAKSGLASGGDFKTPQVLPAQAASRESSWLDEWNGPVVATATAVGALVISEQHGGGLGEIGQPAEIDSAYQGDLSELIVGSMHWLARRQHTDGGWTSSSTDRDSPSHLMTSMIVRATFQLTGAPAAYPDLTQRMSQFIKRSGGVGQMKLHYGPLHSATLLTRSCSALAEVVDWKQLPIIPLERAAFDKSVSRVQFWKNREPFLPAIYAAGVAGFKLNKPLNPLTLWRRAAACHKAIDWLDKNQFDNGSFQNSVPVTSLVLMSLASVGLTSQSIVRRGVEYLFEQVRGDGSWFGVQ